MIDQVRFLPGEAEVEAGAVKVVNRPVTGLKPSL